MKMGSDPIQPDVGEVILFPATDVIHRMDWEEKDDLRHRARRAFDQEEISYDEYDRILSATGLMSEIELERGLDELAAVIERGNRQQQMRDVLIVLLVVLLLFVLTHP